ncbi:N-acetylmuramoyl-L-alanine amidase [Cryptosporangium phraense]|uniref:N-acetylmuramoyl-L-alanine amidase n=1 Tax=Cryptosporangium phraense TaxID=2593070 RepID=A0A545AJJ6_9ACTN|nr:N-acetylmuramoyl-L-alanine amidase [Cryptosporangium phraense]TQS41471.1 N-acetylmuramoyl-L-alanine amidase [Cryptosporangium phraense]
MQFIKRGTTGPAAAEVKSTLVTLGLIADSGPESPDDVLFDAVCELALREFQQSRGLSVDGVVGPETWRSLVAARWRLGDRVLHRSVSEPMLGDDVRTLQERLLEMGYDVGRADGIFGQRTETALRAFQREVGLAADGTMGTLTMRALRQLGRKVVGGRPQLLRESAMLYHAGPALSGKRVVIDPGHGGNDPGMMAQDGPMTWTEANLVYDLANRLEGRFSAIGVRADLTRGRDHERTGAERAALANTLGADLLISLHIDSNPNPAANGVATYHYGTGSGVSSTVGERLAGLVQREIAARTGLLDGHTHAKTWEILRLTRMPAVQIELGYLSSPIDRPRLIDPAFRDTVAEAILIAVQRVFLPVEADVKTGSLDLSALKAMQFS